MRSFLMRCLLVAYSVLFLAAAYCLGKEWGRVQAKETEKGICVVIDPGHGGADPGKISPGGIFEKDINLKISSYLKEYLEEAGVKAVMTRDRDESLAEEGEANPKRADMRKRVEYIDKAGPTVAVSIHQNSFPAETVHGAQVFYYEGSKQGERLARFLQEELKNTLDPENKRQIKGEGNYYLLKNTEIPMVIVECGFLTNAKEEKLLSQEGYQRKVAEAIGNGILKYLKQPE